MPKRYPRGSEWRKWDLHVHSPASALNNQFTGATLEEKWRNYFTKLRLLTDVSVIGVTDYFSIDGYKKVITEGGLTNFDLIVPNVELRILPVTDSETPINIHIIFDPSIVDDLESKFFSSLEYRYNDDTYKCTRVDLIKLGRKYRNNQQLEENAAFRDGIEQFKTTITALRDIFAKNKTLAERSIVVVSNSSNDGNSGIKHSSLAATREEIYRFANCVFSSNPSDREFFLGMGADSKEEFIRKYGSIKPCIHGSDAHDLNTIGRPCTKRGVVGHICNDQDCELRHCWIKADPTFDGLKQIIYEPDERVRIQENSPYQDRKKVFFENITLEGSTHFILPNLSLSLNRELVTLIGGRGSGKSVLLESFAFLNEEHLKEDQNGKKKVIEFYRDNDIHSEPAPAFSLKTTLVDKDGNSHGFQKSLIEHDGLELPFLYLGQEQLSGMATNDLELTKTICGLIGIDITEFNRQDLVIRAREILARIKVEEKTLGDIFQKFIALGYKDGDLEKWIEEHIKKLSDQQTRLSSKETKAILEEINKNTQRGIKLKELVNDSNISIATLGKLEANENLVALTKKIKAIYPDIQISLVDTKKQLGEINAFKAKATADMDRLREEIKTKKTELLKQGIKEDVNTLLQSSETLQQQISAMEKDLENYRTSERGVASAKTERNALMDNIETSLRDLRDQISKNFIVFQKSRDDSSSEEKELFGKIITGIGVEGDIVFEERKFLNGLLTSYIDNRKIPNETELKKQIAGENPDGTSQDLTIDKVLNWVRNDLNNAKYFNRGGDERTIEYILTEWSDFLRVKAIVKLNSKPIEILSIGQRGTLLLKVYLSTATARQVFIIDQPEDNLDNNFIMHELVPLILRTKKSRQIIMSTHNANLVVNADAEQVIVARLDVNKQYLSGSIEDPEINKSIRDILEGGEEAFRQREKKYGIKS
jgi:ABC-type cobalamin/Fe3+-siderophores transport system ATPase subunit